MRFFDVSQNLTSSIIRTIIRYFVIFIIRVKLVL